MDPTYVLVAAKVNQASIGDLICFLVLSILEVSTFFQVQLFQDLFPFLDFLLTGEPFHVILRIVCFLLFCRTSTLLQEQKLESK